MPEDQAELDAPTLGGFRDVSAVYSTNELRRADALDKAIHWSSAETPPDAVIAAAKSFAAFIAGSAASPST